MLLRTRRLTPFLWILPTVALVGVFVYFPLVDNLWLSLHSWSVFSTEQRFVGVFNYARAFADPVFWIAIRNNVAYAVVSVGVQVGGGLVLAAVVDEYVTGRLRTILRSVYFLPATMSITVVSVLFGFIYHPRVGLLNSGLAALGLGSLSRGWLGEADTAIWAIIAMSQWQWTGYVAVLLLVAMQRIPRELYEAQSIDGAGRIRQFIHITMPLTRETTTVMIIVTISNAFLVFNEILATTNGGPSNSSQVLGTWIYQNAFVNDKMGYAAALSALVLVVTLSIGIVQLIYTQRKSVDF